MAEEEIAFSASAFDVVGSWLLGGKSGASAVRVDEAQDRSAALKKTSVSLYRPSAKTTTVAGGGNGGGGANGKLLTEEEKEMKKKLLRKPGSYSRQQTEDPEVEEDTSVLDKEEEELLRARRGEASEAKPKASIVEAGRTEAVGAGAGATSLTNKKRKVSAQDELLEKLREEAARKKAKNLKAKQRLQRKKEEMRKQQQAQTK